MKTITTAQLQKEIQAIANCKMISGEVTINVDVYANNYAELSNQQNKMLSNIVAPEGFDKNDHQIFKKDLIITIFFSLIRN